MKCSWAVNIFRKDCACCWARSPAESRIQLSLVCPLAQTHNFTVFSIHRQQFEPRITRAKSHLIARTRSKLDWLNPGWRYELPLLSYFSDFVVSAAIEKRHLFYFFCTSAVLRPDSLSRHTWCEWWRSESLHRACLSWCVGLVAVLVGPQCREVAGHLC